MIYKYDSILNLSFSLYNISSKLKQKKKNWLAKVVCIVQWMYVIEIKYIITIKQNIKRV